MIRSRGYAPFACSEYQDQMLDSMLDMCRSSKEQLNTKVAVFDLDGCLFDTRYRQIMIFREFASRSGIFELNFIEPHMIVDWNLRTPLQKIGLSESRIDTFYKEMSDYWWKCFFDSDYVRMDYALPGACDFVRACYSEGSYVVYLTGRDHNMRTGTEECLRGFGFPYDTERSTLITKAEFFAMPVPRKSKSRSPERTQSPGRRKGDEKARNERTMPCSARHLTTTWRHQGTLAKRLKSNVFQSSW